MGERIDVKFGGPDNREKDRRDGAMRICRHRQKELDTESRTVSCVYCKKQLDAFDALVEIMRDERNALFAHQRYEEERKRVQELRNEEKKIKARIRNAKRKDADEALKAERERHALEMRRVLAQCSEVRGLVSKMENACARVAGLKRRGSGSGGA